MSQKVTKELIKNINNPSKLKEVVTGLLKDKIAAALEQKKVVMRKKQLKEGALDTLQASVSGHSAKAIKFSNGQQLTVDAQTANMLLTVYKALQKPDMKSKFEKMLGDSPTSFMKLVDFGWKQVG